MTKYTIWLSTHKNSRLESVSDTSILPLTSGLTPK